MNTAIGNGANLDTSIDSTQGSTAFEGADTLRTGMNARVQKTMTLPELLNHIDTTCAKIAERQRFHTRETLMALVSIWGNLRQYRLEEAKTYIEQLKNGANISKDFDTLKLLLGVLYVDVMKLMGTKFQDNTSLHISSEITLPYGHSQEALHQALNSPTKTIDTGDHRKILTEAVSAGVNGEFLRLLGIERLNRLLVPSKKGEESNLVSVNALLASAEKDFQDFRYADGLRKLSSISDAITTDITIHPLTRRELLAGIQYLYGVFDKANEIDSRVGFIPLDI